MSSKNINTVVFSSKPYDKQFLSAAKYPASATMSIQWHFIEAHLSPETASLAKGADVVCVFVNDVVSEAVIRTLKTFGVKLIALRCAGFNNVDLKAAATADIPVVRVPAYSPYAVAEHTIALLLMLNRKLHRAYNRVREGNFSLDGLMGFDLHGKTVSIIGTGKIGHIVGTILSGFGCNVLAVDPHSAHDFPGRFVDWKTALQEADILTLHCPLTPQTHHLLNTDSFAQMKPGVMILNTSRGALIDTQAAIEALKSGQIGALGLDVYEEEGDLFFEDLSNNVIQDDTFMRLLTFPNVVITGHQAFFTQNALENIAQTTVHNIHTFFNEQQCPNQVFPPEST